MRRNIVTFKTALIGGTLLLAIAMTLFIAPTNLTEDQCVYLVDGVVPAGIYGAVTTVAPINNDESFLSGVQVYCNTEPAGKLHVLADVTVDPSFIERSDINWKGQVRQMFQNVNLILEPVHIKIEVASLQTWEPNQTFTHISQRLSAAEEQAQRQPGSLLIAITSDAASRFDGLARRDGGALIVRHYANHPERGPMLIVHEFGHLLGANHHGEDDDCGDDECIMASTGYIRTNEWCHHHLEVIEENMEARLGHSIS